MSQEQQGRHVREARERLTNARKRLERFRIKANEMARHLRAVADALPQGRMQDKQRILSMPNTDSVLTYHEYIMRELTEIDRCEKEIQR